MAIKKISGKAQPAPPEFNPEKRSIVVASKYIAMMETFVSTEETRYYLTTGVYIEPHQVEGVVMVATDGHRMAVIHDKEGKIKGSEGWICPVPEDVFKACRKKTRKNEEILGAQKVHFVGSTVAVTDGQYTGKLPLDLSGGVPTGVMTLSRAEPIDGTYPDWRRVLPKKKPVTESHNMLAFNPEYMWDFGTVIKAAGLPDTTSAVMFPSPIGVASIIRFKALPEFFGLLMGCYATPGFVAIPAWVQAERTKVTKRDKGKKKAK